MTLRDKRQEEFADLAINRGLFGILNLCPRFGKIRTCIQIFKKTRVENVLIAYPDKKIQDSWEKEFTLCGNKPEKVTYTTFVSLYKYELDSFDLVVLDEIHLLSPNQTAVCQGLLRINERVVGLTGTLSSSTRKYLKENLNLSVIGIYPIETAIAEGVITDYEITILTVPLDNVVKQLYGKFYRSERNQFNHLNWIINKQEEEGKDTKFFKFARLRIVQNSIGKLKKTKEVLSSMKDDRVLVFCGSIPIADGLGIPSHHSKSKDPEALLKFANGEGDKLAVIKMGNTGVTYKPLDTVIINYFDSNSENLAQKINRCMGMEYKNPEKKAKIIIISSTEEIELGWLRGALKLFEPSKIIYK